MNAIDFLLDQQAAHSRAKQAPAIDPEAAVLRLREAAARYREMVDGGPRFSIGDVIYPIRDSNISAPYAGLPHLVVYIEDPAEYHFGAASAGYQTEGRWLDTRVLVLRDDAIAAFWVESFEF